MRRYLSAVAALSLIVFAAACGSGDSSGSAQGGDTKLVVYSGREEELVEPLFKKFEQKTGIDVEVRYGDSAELAATLAEEGGNSPADVFFAQDPGSLGAVEGQGMLAKLPATTLDLVPDRFRDPDGHWVGTSGRARVVAYNTDELTEAELPDSVLDYTDPKWKGKIGLPPTNASFQAFVSSMVLSLGEERTRQWLEGIKANDPKLYEKNTPVVEAVAAGEIQVGFVNHYYLYLVKEEQPDAPVANDYLPGTDPGALVSVAGAAILESADHKDAAARFVEYLLSEEGQRFYVDEAEEAEYPVIPGIEPKAGLPPLDSLQGPKIQLDDLGAQLEKTLELLNEVGFTA
ncbi:MAG: iron(III) transport system substrate-binding protein [Gaiellales bacterium]|jgi:iron(III) transport system substrate-binding protein|nr:iron(III) transport system substrate-binding protein [Gaiellales bacterium]